MTNQLTKAIEKRIEVFMDGVYECDDIDATKLEGILADGGKPAARVFQEHFLLDAAIFQRAEDAVRLLLEAGVDPNFGEFEPPLVTARSRKGEVSERILALMLQYGATE